MTSGCVARSTLPRAPTGTSGPGSAAGALTCSPAISTATACLALPWRRPHASAPAWSRPLDRSQSQGARRTARALRKAPRADLRRTLYSLDHGAAGITLWTGHSAGAVQGARRRFAARNQRRRERARGAPGLRLRHRGELFRLAGVQPPIRAGAEPLASPYLQRQNFDAVRSRSGRVRYLQRSFTDILRNCGGGKLRSLGLA